MLVLIAYLVICSLASNLGENLIVNGKFQNPDLVSQKIRWKLIPKNIPGWNCSNYCQIGNCLLQIQQYLQYRMLFGYCKGQVLDVVSNQTELITQIVETTQGDHILDIEFFIPMRLANKKTLFIYFNQKIIYQYRPLVTSDPEAYYIALNISAKTGKNNLTFTVGGLFDAYGFRLAAVSMRRIINPQVQALISTTYNNSAILGIISFPASKTIIGNVFTSLVSLDRLQFYYFHNRNHSYNIDLFLGSISTLLNNKASFSIDLQEKALGNLNSKLKNFITQLDYKYNYINTKMLSKSDNGFGFVSNNADLFIYSIPFYVAFIALFCILFRVTFNHRVSKIVRKYSFFGVIFLVMLCEGNIEQYSFYIFGEFTSFFSKNFKHKLVNGLIVCFFFNVIIFSVALYFLLWACYNKKSKYFIDNVRVNLKGITSYSFSNSLICLLLGAEHQLLINFPNLQLLVIGSTQIVWICVQMILLYQGLYRNCWNVWRKVYSGLLRILFQLTIYLYANSADKLRGFLNENIHFNQIVIFTALWILQFFGQFLSFVYESIDMLTHKQRRTNNSRQQNGKEMKAILHKLTIFTA